MKATSGAKILRKYILAISCSTIYSCLADSITEQDISTTTGVFNFDLPRQALSDSLLNVALKTKTSLVVDFSLLEKLSSSALLGNFTTDQALHLLLFNSNLDYRLDATNGTLLISASDNNERQRPQKNDVPETPIIHEVIVHGARYPFRYSASEQSSFGKKISQHNYAHHTNVITKELIFDTKPNEIKDLLLHGSSISPSDGLADSNDDFFIRGFPRGAIYLNGLRLDSRLGSKISPLLVESVEILKGPSTLRFGQAEPGGAVNIIPRVPSTKSQSIGLGIGSNNQKILSFEGASGSFGDFSVGLIASQKDAAQARNLKNISSSFIFPTLRYQYGDSGQISIDYLKQDTRHYHTQGTILLVPDGESLDLISTNIESASENPQFSSDLDIVHINVTHEIENSWLGIFDYYELQEGRSGIRGNQKNISDTPTFASVADLTPVTEFIQKFEETIELNPGTVIQQDDKTISPTATINSIDDEQGSSGSRFFRAQIDGEIDNLARKSNLTIGAEIFELKTIDLVIFQRREDIGLIALSPDGTTNVFDTIKVDKTENNTSGEQYFRSQALVTKDTSIYLNNTMEINNSLTLGFGGRFTKTRGIFYFNNINDAFTIGELNNFKKTISAIYKPTQHHSIFTNYSEGMKARYVIDDYGRTAKKPGTSRQYEIGFKYIQEQFFSTLSAYKIEENNTVNIIFTDSVRSVTSNGSSRVYGLDLDFTYKLNRKLQLVGSYSILDSKIVNGAHADNEFPYVASMSSSVYARYNIRNGVNNQFNIKAGALYLGDRYGDNENSIVINGYSSIDAGLSYSWIFASSAYELDLSVYNILNADYTSSIGDKIRRNNGDRRTVKVTVSVSF